MIHQKILFHTLLTFHLSKEIEYIDCYIYIYVDTYIYVHIKSVGNRKEAVLGSNRCKIRTKFSRQTFKEKFVTQAALRVLFIQYLLAVKLIERSC